MKQILLLIIPLLSFGFIGCVESEPDGPHPRPPLNSKSYIQGFFELNDIYVSPISGVKVDKVNKMINLMSTSFDDPKVYDLADGVGLSVSIGSDGLGKGLITWQSDVAGKGNSSYYNELVEKIGDTSYNSKEMYSILGSNHVMSIVDTLQYVNIVCNKVFDKDHPAGTSLNDIFSIYFEDPYTIVKDGYKALPASNHYFVEGMSKKFPHFLFGEKLSAVNFLEKTYIGNMWCLVLEKLPELEGEYAFSATVISNRGTKIEKTAILPIKLKGLN